MNSFEKNSVLPEDFDPSNGEQYRPLISTEFFPDIAEVLDGEGVDGIDVGDAIILTANPNAVTEDWQEMAQTPNGKIDFVNKYVVFPERYDPSENIPDGLNLEEFSNYVLGNGFAESPKDFFGAQFSLPKPVELVGGRFAPRFRLHNGDEFLVPILYYWDSWATNRGMGNLPGGNELMRHTLDNFKYISKRLGGLITNSSTIYGMTRSQPDVLPNMVRNISKIENEEQVVGDEYLELLEDHFDFWNSGAEDIESSKDGQKPFDHLGKAPGAVYRNAVRMSDGSVMYRFYDEGKGPRPEMRAQDIKVAEEFKSDFRGKYGHEPSQEQVDLFYSGMRVGAADGEDFNMNLTEDGKNLFTVQGEGMISAKLNSQLFEHASLLAFVYDRKYQKANKEGVILSDHYFKKRQYYFDKVDSLRNSITKYCMGQGAAEITCDYDFVNNKPKPPKSLSAAIWPVAAGIELGIGRGQEMLDKIDEAFYIEDVGLVNTLYEDSNEQWDGNIWPIHQMVAVDAAILYGRYDLAYKWCEAFLGRMEEIYSTYGKVFEKISKTGGIGDGGEYDCVPNLRMTIGVIKEFYSKREHLKKMATDQASWKKDGKWILGQHFGLLVGKA
jgi:alpha,alpha-trehalase